ncbi:fused MFS/spermidine synthase [Magnetovibrio sp. PR-2]|uniref:spermidine synthase n=1 Tax=Magnetovibrio sp. PR-2 TaxID=3120356 RepID=UPI002FCE30F3
MLNRFHVAVFMATLMTSAGLLFWLQPMIAKFILPKLGGAPAVWNTAMMFFQAALLAGYLYAHLLSHRAGLKAQVGVHTTLLLMCVLWLPISVDPDLAPSRDGNPSWWVLSALTISVGAPFVVIAGSAPLLQSWFGLSAHKDAHNPYFLYAASNVGSMAALFCYPLVAEPLLDLGGQSWAWSLAFVALIVLTVLSGAISFKTAVASHQAPAKAPLDHRPPALHKFFWFMLVMASTSLMLGVTTHLTTDVAAVPLLWVVPLALYLLTYIIVFARKPLLGTERALQVLFVSLVGFGVLWGLEIASSQWVLWALALVLVFFFTVLSVHSQLAQLRPHKAWLTEFYLWIAAGGVAGGMFNALLAPQMFKSATEFPLMMGLSVCLILASRRVFEKRPTAPMLGLAGVCFVLPVGLEMAGQLTPSNVVARERNFFGILSVVEDRTHQFRALKYGTTAHGMRDLKPGQDLEPVGYYGRTSPLGDVMPAIAARAKTGNIAAIGLGVGSVACYPLGGRTLDIFEINPAVTAFAEHPEYFNFLKGCKNPYTVEHGDGRLGIQDKPDGAYDLIFLDAFTSDSIPVHLLTREAFEVYVHKLSPHGVILAHISNNHLDLAPVLGGIAGDLGLAAFERLRQHNTSPEEHDRVVNAQAHMVAIARTSGDLFDVKNKPEWQALEPQTNMRVWTDAYSNILGALRALK